MKKINTTHLAWHHFQFDIPHVWEVVKYKTDPDNGEMILSTRDGVAMQIFWGKVKEKPNITRRLQELVKANLKEKNMAELDDAAIKKNISHVHNWDVYRHTSKSFPVFAGCYLEKEKILLNITLPVLQKNDPREIIDSILSTYHENNGEDIFWGIGGIDAKLPKEYKLNQIELLPSFQKIFFETKKGYRVVLYRYAMMSKHLENQSLAEFFARATGRKKELFFKDEFTKDRQDKGIELKYYTRGDGNVLTNLISRQWVGDIFIWTSKEKERIYAIESHARKGRNVENLIDRLKAT